MQSCGTLYVSHRDINTGIHVPLLADPIFDMKMRIQMWWV